jgi:S-adenosylmethionine:tRNA ribosyltransferase-isomerase
VAAPTAGLHFTPALLGALAARGVERVPVTLHVGPGTFAPLREDDVTHHELHAERFVVSKASAQAVTRARAEGRPVVAVGTTVVRALESAAGEDGRVRPFAGSTRLFVRPGYRFRAVDMLITNFHLPRSTLLMLVAAFAGSRERILQAYADAIVRGYRFYSYGDAMLLR